MASSAKAYRVLSCLKILLILFTIFFLGTGVLFLATGIYGLIAMQHYFELSSTVNLSLTPTILCGIGGTVVLFGLFGMLSACKNNKWMINCYCFFLAIVFIIEVGGGVAAIIFMGAIKESFQLGLADALTYYNPSITNPIDKAQSELQCCGVTSYRDWFNTSWDKTNHQCDDVTTYTTSLYSNITTVPLSCCKSSLKNQSNVLTATPLPSGRHCLCDGNYGIDSINQEGCLNVLFGTKGQTLHYLLASTFGVATVQIFGIFLSLCIYQKLRQIKSSKRHY